MTTTTTVATVVTVVTAIAHPVMQGPRDAPSGAQGSYVLQDLLEPGNGGSDNAGGASADRPDDRDSGDGAEDRRRDAQRSTQTGRTGAAVLGQPFGGASIGSGAWCIRCKTRGHAQTDRCCPHYGTSKPETDQRRLAAEDPLTLIAAARADGLIIKSRALGRTVDSRDPNQVGVASVRRKSPNRSLTVRERSSWCSPIATTTTTTMTIRIWSI